jgi:UDP-2,4-diacetamido-2,4,6-trideoxy-beta-L-altropyranose hydrolase/UDP-4-amino-4,6-dideoxy-N-acetyl-beta-L-altrosamine N-acetyltransferase
MKIFFRVDASINIGTGHVMRCLTLAQVLKESGAKVEFICYQYEGNLIDKIRLNGFNVYELEILGDRRVSGKLAHSSWLGVTQQQDADDCIDILKVEKTNWLIVDHYALDEEWQIKLKPYCEKLMVIDDLADRKHQCDILLDQTFGRQQKEYLALTPKGCELLLGSQYALLRPEFDKWREYSIKRRSKPKFKQLLINMGGVDVDNMTGKILKELQNCILPRDVNVVIVMGVATPHLESVRIEAGVLPYKTKIKVNVDNMAEIMANSDIAIGAAGSTTWERCCLGLPTIQISIAENQIFLAKMLAHQNAVQLVTEIKEIGPLLENSDEWMKIISVTASQICDGIGAYKTFNRMSNYKTAFNTFGEIELCNYINLNMNEKILTLNMRNHPNIRKWMYNQKSISKKDHFGFIENLKTEIDRRYFLVKQQGNIIGSINFSKINFHNSVELGIYTNPFIHLKGSGSLLEAVASQYAFNELGLNKIKLEVFLDNERAINFYNKCGFKLVNTRKINHQNILYMEKEKKHWRAYSE